MYPAGGFQMPDRFGLPSGPRGMAVGDTLVHCVKADEENRTSVAHLQPCFHIGIPGTRR